MIKSSAISPMPDTKSLAYASQDSKQKRIFDENAEEFYPAQCCETLHASNAVYLSTFMQLFFFIIVGVLYYMLEQKNYVASIAVFRPCLTLFGVLNLLGIFSAVAGVMTEKHILVKIQIVLLTGLITIADACALFLIGIMALGSRSPTAAALPSQLIDVNKFEILLGPFWIYICAIILHMCAAVHDTFHDLD
uniref:Uncharacterized protein n=1 Tax=Rhabditophanes sp. KR3021 TaxID=114890 RepID=A0AC35TQN6_9BILA